MGFCARHTHTQTHTGPGCIARYTHTGPGCIAMCATRLARARAPRSHTPCAQHERLQRQHTCAGLHTVSAVVCLGWSMRWHACVPQQRAPRDATEHPVPMPCHEMHAGLGNGEASRHQQRLCDYRQLCGWGSIFTLPRSRHSLGTQQPRHTGRTAAETQSSRADKQPGRRQHVWLRCGKARHSSRARRHTITHSSAPVRTIKPQGQRKPSGRSTIKTKDSRDCTKAARHAVRFLGRGCSLQGSNGPGYHL